MGEGEEPRGGGKGGLARAEQSPRPREEDKTGPRWEFSCRAKSLTPCLAFQPIRWSRCRCTRGEFRPTEKGQLSEVRTRVIREMQRKERETCQVNASLGGSWCQPSLSQELTEPITTQEGPTLKAELSQPRRKCPSVRRPEASGHVVGSHRPVRFKRAGRSPNTMPDQE